MSEPFKFKSSGINISHRKFKPSESQAKSKLRPIGIKTPLSFGDDENEFLKCHVDPIEQVKDNLKNLILTNNGERLGRFNYGCNLQSLLMESNALDQELQSQITKSIIEQTRRHIPIVNIDNIMFDRQPKSASGAQPTLSIIDIIVRFALPKLQQRNLAIKVTMSMGA